MTQELLILGLLKEGAKHGYQIKKLIRQISESFTTIKTTSIYYPLSSLERKGLLKKRITKEGKRPQKYVYYLTQKGRLRFYQLLLKNFLILERPFINVDLSLYFSPFIKKDILLHRIKRRLRGLRRICRWLFETQESLKKKKYFRKHLDLILTHNIYLIKAEIAFTQKLLKEIS